MKIIITGGLGYVGGRLSQYFAVGGHEVIALSRKAGFANKAVRLKNLTVLHPDQLRGDLSLLRGTHAFIHLAALNEHECVKYPEEAIDVNVKQTMQWLAKAEDAGASRFVYFSTAHVYGKPLLGQYTEQSLARPVHPYAITHRCAEDYVIASHDNKGINHLVIRLTNAFGGPAFPTADRWTLLVNDLCRSAVKDRTMTLLSDGLQLRDFICLHDVCAAVDHLLTGTVAPLPSPIINLSSGISMSVWDMACRVKALAEEFLDSEVKLTRKQPAPEATIAPLTISNDVLRASGFRLRNDIDAEIISTLQFFQENKA
jgi:UDP-glucose 4-epimerase